MSRAPQLRSRRPFGLRRSLTHRYAIIALTMIVFWLSAGPAFAGQSHTEGAVTPYAADLIVAPSSPLLTPSVERFSFGVTIRNTGESLIPAGELRLLLNTEPLSQPAPADVEPPPRAAELIRQTLPEIPAGEEETLTLVVPRDAFPLSLASGPGVYAVHAQLHPPKNEPFDTYRGPLISSPATPFVWQGAGNGAQIAVTTLVPFVLPQSVRTMPSTAQLQEIAPKLLELLDVAESMSATLAVDPRIPAAIRVLEDDSPASAQELLARLETTTRPLFLLQFADADPAVQAALGRDTLLEPLGLDYLIPEAETRESADVSELTTVNDVVDAETRMQRLTALPQAFPASWPAAGNIDSATLTLLKNAGLTSIVLDSTSVSAPSGTRVQLGDFSALIADHALTELSRSALSSRTSAERAAGLAEIAARLALAAQQDLGGVVLAVDRGAIADATNPAGFLRSIEELSWVREVPEAEQPPGTANLQAGETFEERRELLRATLVRSDEIDRLAPLLVTPDFLLQYQRVRVLEALATRYAESEAAFTEFDTQVKARDAELLQGVQIVGVENTQLVGTSSRIPITLHNALPFPAQVTLQVTPVSAAIAVPERTFPDQAISAEGNHVVLVGVDARVSSGEAGLHAEVLDAWGESPYAAQTLKLTLRSSTEAVLMISLGSLTGLLLGFGIWRSIRHRRRELARSAHPSHRDVDETSIGQTGE